MAERHCTCDHCGSEFVTTKSVKIYCSRKCNHAAFVARHPDKVAAQRDREREKARAARELLTPVVLNECSTCGRSFYWRKKKARCSRECELRAKTEYYRSRFLSEKVREERVCACCGRKFVSNTAAQIHCSCKCSARKHKTPRDARKRAAKYGVEYQPVTPAKVFDRDGWKCQICGKQTPQSRRGTRYANAPELDHRIPISKGGPHNYSNTQCACRACNSAKSNLSSVGQMPLLC